MAEFKFNRWTTANQTVRQLEVMGAILNKMAVSCERKSRYWRISLLELQDGWFQPMEDTSGAPLYNPREFGGTLCSSFCSNCERTDKQTNQLNYIYIDYCLWGITINQLIGNCDRHSNVPCAKWRITQNWCNVASTRSRSTPWKHLLMKDRCNSCQKEH